MLNSSEFDLNKLCRTCLSTGQMKSLYDQSISELCLADMLLLCTSVQYKRNNVLPAQICHDCVTEINQSYKFAIKCQESEENLQKYLQNKLNLEIDVVKHDLDYNTGNSLQYPETDTKIIRVHSPEIYKSLSNELPIIKVRYDLNDSIPTLELPTNQLLTDQPTLASTENKSTLSDLLPTFTIQNNLNNLDPIVENQKNITQLSQINNEIENCQNQDLSWLKNEIDHKTNLQTMRNDLVINKAKVSIKIENNSEILNTLTDPLELPTEATFNQITESLNDQSVTLGNITIKSEKRAGEIEKNYLKTQTTQITNTKINPIVKSLSDESFIPVNHLHPVVNLERLNINILPENVRVNSNVTTDVIVIEHHDISPQENVQNYQTDTNSEASKNFYEFRKRTPRVQSYIESNNEDSQSDYCDSGLSNYGDSDSETSNDENNQNERINKKQSSNKVPQIKQRNIVDQQTERLNDVNQHIEPAVNYQIEQPTTENQSVWRNIISYQGVRSNMESNQSEISNVVVNRAEVVMNCQSITNVDTLPEETDKRGCQCRMCLKSDNTSHLRRALETNKCLICGDIFSLKQTLKIHIMQKHTNERPHKCIVCNVAFATKDDLTRHSVLHSKIKPYPCTVCDSKYTKRSQLTLHMVKHQNYLMLMQARENKLLNNNGQQSIVSNIINYQTKLPNMVNSQIEHTNSADLQHESLNNINKLPNIHQNEPFTINQHRDSSNNINYQSQLTNNTNHLSIDLTNNLSYETEQSNNINYQSKLPNNINHQNEQLNNTNHLIELSNNQSEQSINMNQPKQQLNNANNELELLNLNPQSSHITNNQGNNSNDHREQSNNMNDQYERSNNEEHLSQLLQNKNYQNDLCINMDQPSKQLNFTNLRTLLLNNEIVKKKCLCRFCGDTLEENGSCLKCDEDIASLLVKKVCVKRHKCKLCNGAFKNPSDLKRHLMTHTGERPFSCSICAKTFAVNYELVVHKRTHTMEKPYSCDVCNKTFVSKHKLTCHKYIHPGEGLVCFVCGKKYLNPSRMERHMEQHNNTRFPCAKCDKVYNLSKSLHNHMKLKHPTTDPVICDICGKKCVTKERLISHMRSHSSIKPFSCKICGKSVRSSQLLKQHMRTHTNERPYSCTVCKKSFKTAANLELHTRTHKDARPYACTLCDFTFKIRHHLNAHIERKHPSKE